MAPSSRCAPPPRRYRHRATLIDPWGPAIQQLYHDLRAMLAELPELCIVLVVHFSKPKGRGGRQVSDVLGEWGRWCDILVLLERDKDRTKLSTHKRVRQQRRILATRAGGLLVDPQDITDGKAVKKVPEDRVLAVIEAHPGISYHALADQLGVAKSTAENYVKALADRVTRTPSGPRGSIRLAVTARPPDTTHHEGLGGDWAVAQDEEGGDHPSTQPPYAYKAVGWAVTDSSGPEGQLVEDEYPASAWKVD